MDKREFIRNFCLGVGGCSLHLKAFPFNNLSLLPKNHSIEAWFFSNTAKGTNCLLCPNNCIVKSGETALCRNRVNINGRLFSTAYGNPCAVHLDPIAKLPLYHFLPSSDSLSLGLAGCNLSCLNCQNWSFSQEMPTETRNYTYMPDEAVKEAIKHECKSIAFTYSEPTTYIEYVYDTAILARESFLKTVIKSSGYVNEEPLRKLSKVIDAANVDLKSFSNKIYKKLNAGKLDPVLKSLLVLKEEGIWLEITNLIIPSWTDDLDMIKKMCNWLLENGFEHNPLHFSRFYPDYKLTKLPSTPLNSLLSAAETAKNEGLLHVYIDSIPGIEESDTRCPGCDKKLVKRRGYQIIRNEITDSQCSYCGTEIHGIWT